jgi:hypothetical protein
MNLTEQRKSVNFFLELFHLFSDPLATGAIWSAPPTAALWLSAELPPLAPDSKQASMQYAQPLRTTKVVLLEVSANCNEVRAAL